MAFAPSSSGEEYGQGKESYRQCKEGDEKIRNSVLESDDLQVISSELKNKTETILNLKSVKNTRSKISSLAKKVARSEVTKNAIEITKDAKRTLGVNIKVVDDIDDRDDDDDDDDDGVKIVCVCVEET